MEKIIPFIKNNYLMLLLGLFFYGLFVYYNATGNRICDCESTENYKPNSTARIGTNRFYHK
jgi:hypothetical protein